MIILQCLSHFLPERQAGTEIYAWALSKELQKAGHCVFVVIPALGSTESREYAYEGLRVFQYAEPSQVDRSLLNGQRPPDGLKDFAGLVENLRPDLVHFHEYSPGNGITVLHLEAVRKLGIPTVMTMHLAAYSCRTGRLMYRGRSLCDGIIRAGRCTLCSLQDTLHNPVAAALLYGASMPFYRARINPNRWNNRLGTALGFPFFIGELRKGLDRAVASLDRIIVLTEWYKKILMHNGVPGHQLRYIPQGLPYSASTVARKQVPDRRGQTGVAGQTGKRSSPLRLLFIGRIDPFKGVHLLLEAVEGIDPGEITLDIYGQAVDEKYYQQCLARSRGRENIHWKGVVGQQDLIPLLSGYDALCLPSTFSEMSPLVIQEAFAAGIPLIGSDVYGIAEQVKDGVNGLLFPFNQADALRERIRRLLDEPGLLDRLTANTQAPPSFLQVMQETETVYRELVLSHASKIPG